MVVSRARAASVATRHKNASAREQRRKRLCVLTATSTRISLKFFLFTLLRALWHTQKLNSFLFNLLRTLYPKTPGVGIPARSCARSPLHARVLLLARIGLAPPPLPSNSCATLT